MAGPMDLVPSVWQTDKTPAARAGTARNLSHCDDRRVPLEAGANRARIATAVWPPRTLNGCPTREAVIAGPTLLPHHPWRYLDNSDRDTLRRC